MPSLSIMTYNIRYMGGDKDENAWELRREALIRLILSRSPDILCVQEPELPQVEYLIEKLEGYGFYGIGRADGKSSGEFSPVFYKKERFTLEDSFTKWMSETPDVPSKGWGAHHFRICSAVLLREHDGTGIFAGSLHLDLDYLPRFNGMEPLRAMSVPYADSCQVFLAGDYNMYTHSPEYDALCRPPFFDARLACPEYSDFGSFQGFGRITNLFELAPIDHIFMTKGAYSPVRAEILAQKVDGRYPSDHFPLLLTLER